MLRQLFLLSAVIMLAMSSAFRIVNRISLRNKASSKHLFMSTGAAPAAADGSDEAEQQRVKDIKATVGDEGMSMFGEEDTVAAAKALIMKTYNLDDTRYNKRNERRTQFVKKYFKGEIDEYLLFDYLNGLNRALPEYHEFGADKCSVDNFRDFCEELNINIEANLMSMVKNREEMIETMASMTSTPYERSTCSRVSRRYHFYSRDRRLMMTISYSSFLTDNYLGYFGVTGGKEEVAKAYLVFSKRIHCSESSWGGRDYI